MIVGYPSTYANDEYYEESLEHLEAEIKEGADFIITQMVFDAATLISFIKRCRAMDINVPIIPGIFPIQVNLGYRVLSLCYEIFYHKF